MATATATTTANTTTTSTVVASGPAVIRRTRHQRSSSIEIAMGDVAFLRQQLESERARLSDAVVEEHTGRIGINRQEEAAFTLMRSSWRKLVDDVAYRKVLKQRAGIEDAMPNSIVSRMGELLAVSRLREHERRQHVDQQRIDQRRQEIKKYKTGLARIQQKRVETRRNRNDARRNEIEHERIETRMRVNELQRSRLQKLQGVVQGEHALVQRHWHEKVATQAMERHTKRRYIEREKASSVSPSAFLRLPPLKHVMSQSLLLNDPAAVERVILATTPQRPREEGNDDPGENNTMTRRATATTTPVMKSELDDREGETEENRNANLDDATLLECYDTYYNNSSNKRSATVAGTKARDSRNRNCSTSNNKSTAAANSFQQQRRRRESVGAEQLQQRPTLEHHQHNQHRRYDERFFSHWNQFVTHHDAIAHLEETSQRREQRRGRDAAARHEHQQEEGRSSDERVGDEEQNAAHNVSSHGTDAPRRQSMTGAGVDLS